MKPNVLSLRFESRRTPPFPGLLAWWPLHGGGLGPSPWTPHGGGGFGLPLGCGSSTAADSPPRHSGPARRRPGYRDPTQTHLAADRGDEWGEVVELSTRRECWRRAERPDQRGCARGDSSRRRRPPSCHDSRGSISSATVPPRAARNAALRGGGLREILAECPEAARGASQRRESLFSLDRRRGGGLQRARRASSSTAGGTDVHGQEADPELRRRGGRLEAGIRTFPTRSKTSWPRSPRSPIGALMVGQPENAERLGSALDVVEEGAPISSRVLEATPLRPPTRPGGQVEWGPSSPSCGGGPFERRGAATYRPLDPGRCSRDASSVRTPRVGTRRGGR